MVSDCGPVAWVAKWDAGYWGEGQRVEDAFLVRIYRLRLAKIYYRLADPDRRTILSSESERFAIGVIVADASAVRGVEGERAGIRARCDGVNRPSRSPSPEQRISELSPLVGFADTVTDGGITESEGERRLAIAEYWAINRADGPRAVVV